uniref:carboxypeptidase-like regulatory domain-containing protein n=1 Tax=Flavobacterium sp. TaxID=239 RepID=UPI004049D92E
MLSKIRFIHHLIFFHFFFLFFGFAQTNGIIVNEKTQKPIDFVNIWIEDFNESTITDSAGFFSIQSNSEKNTIIFDAVGYEVLRLQVSEIKDTIFMQPIDFILQEVIVRSRKNKKKLTVNKIKKKDIEYYAGTSNEHSWIVAQHFPYQEIYNDFSFLSKISFFNMSLDDSYAYKFNVRIYDVDDHGKPGNCLTTENIFCFPKNGKQTSVVDVSAFNIEIPKKGFFIAIENLQKYNESNNVKVLYGFCNESKISNSYFYYKGKWVSRIESNDIKIKTLNIFELICIEVEVSN